jgi:hypothetical protein
MLDHLALVFALVLAAVLIVFLISFLWLYLGSVCRFILLDAIVRERCGGLRTGWRTWRAAGRRWLVWLVVYQCITFFWFLTLIGTPVLGAWLAGWFSPPGDHVGSLVGVGILVLLAVLASAFVVLAVYVLAKDFIPPMMAAESIGVTEAWDRVRRIVRADRVAIAGYLGMKLVLTIGAALIAISIVVAMAVPAVVAFGVPAVWAQGGGVPWGPATIAAAVLAGSIVVGLIVIVMAALSVPFATFFPAYGLYFLASRDTAVDAWMRTPGTETAPAPAVSSTPAP